MVKAVYLIALDGVTRYSLEKATRKILQGALGHPFMPSPPELRIECDRIMQPHQDYLRTIAERKRRMAWDEDKVRTEPPPDAAKQRMNALWAAVRPMFEKPKPTQTPAEPETEADIVARLSAGWTQPSEYLFTTSHMTKGH
jgi:hypothetical protein